MRETIARQWQPIPCGAGHTWTAPEYTPWSASPERLVEVLARGGVLPELPAKENGNA
jgi:hypothetical protein